MIGYGIDNGRYRLIPENRLSFCRRPVIGLPGFGGFPPDPFLPPGAPQKERKIPIVADRARAELDQGQFCKKSPCHRQSRRPASPRGAASAPRLPRRPATPSAALFDTDLTQVVSFGVFGSQANLSNPNWWRGRGAGERRECPLPTGTEPDPPRRRPSRLGGTRPNPAIFFSRSGPAARTKFFSPGNTFFSTGFQRRA